MIFTKKSKLIVLSRKQTWFVNRSEDFDERFYARFDDKYADCLPIWMDIKYCVRTHVGPGDCLVRSLRMFHALSHENVYLCRGNWFAGKDFHGWVEDENFVYCPSYLKRFPKEEFYKMFLVTDAVRYSLDDIKRESPGEQYGDTWFRLEDYLPGGIMRTYLPILMPFYEYTALLPGQEDFHRDLEAWKKKVQYDYEEITRETEQAIERAMNSMMRTMTIPL